MAKKDKTNKKKTQSEDSEFSVDSLVKSAAKKFKNAAKAAKTPRKNLENGTKIARINAISIKKSNGKESARTEMVVLEGVDKGKQVSKFNGLDTEQGAEYFFRDLSKLGYDPEEALADLKGTLEEIAEDKPVVEINVQDNPKNPDYQN